ncbi:MAG: hypothetical protein JWO60_903 [Frankiales bacterium]|nr:hypothetical protein [Frankiales bacterium]
MRQGYGLVVLTAAVALALIVELLRRRKLTEKYAVIWLLLGLGILVLAVVPRVLVVAADLVGVAVPSNLLFFVAAFALLLVCLQLSGEASKLEDETRRLAEEVALLRQQVRELQARDGG